MNHWTFEEEQETLSYISYRLQPWTTALNSQNLRPVETSVVRFPNQQWWATTLFWELGNLTFETADSWVKTFAFAQLWRLTGCSSIILCTPHCHKVHSTVWRSDLCTGRKARRLAGGSPEQRVATAKWQKISCMQSFVKYFIREILFLASNAKALTRARVQSFKACRRQNFVEHIFRLKELFSFYV